MTNVHPFPQHFITWQKKITLENFSRNSERQKQEIGKTFPLSKAFHQYHYHVAECSSTIPLILSYTITFVHCVTSSIFQYQHQRPSFCVLEPLTSMQKHGTCKLRLRVINVFANVYH
ncbi:hypothetical protein L873DRAFT_825121 [Choiromyces venosus 120613-1]|uniref:Uncharacterized protein n=1 Tax=Choiromyces venosus 120613-1 TaxID=1336337 RepID=A0A3N4JPU6_9PEZI|nr:hypothetical protein L873DRAFT_825121 [Choiromyces venosus 120613-1]